MIKNVKKALVSFTTALFSIVLISSSHVDASNLKLHHKGNAYSSYLGNNEAVNGWSTVVISTSSVMDSNKRQGRTKIQAWARLDTIKEHFGTYYIPTVSAIETKMKSTTANSNLAFDIMGTNPGHRVSQYELDTTIFDLIDYRIPGVGLVGNIANVLSNGIRSGTDQDLSNSKNATLTFLNPTNSSLTNNISWRDANRSIGSNKKSGVTAEFNFRVLNGVQINVAPQARVQYGLYRSTSVVPIKIWSASAYVNHTLN
ncbi:hypothetical protein J2W91_004656 [Paenibacillus amylolyticus]|uniref:WxL domain-containing protein n=1 Tax=Paenibacillus amylolyticus TaxID=1451 RepID=A0AAP5H4E2_PAEAM|nr:hypothetical protein [Paenibacillus amylolyticus]MDR6726150.1 hypothetical protein [Paenibacillus amylolyticus]